MNYKENNASERVYIIVAHGFEIKLKMSYNFELKCPYNEPTYSYLIIVLLHIQINNHINTKRHLNPNPPLKREIFTCVDEQ